MNFRSIRSLNPIAAFNLLTGALLSGALLADVSLPASAADSGGNTLLPFTTDGCSSSPDNEWIGNKSWLDCCVDHDKAYWLGGTAAEKETADSGLKKCLLRAGMGEAMAEVYYRSVQVGGTAHLPTTWKWGYGWKNSRGYDPVTDVERKEAAKYARLLELPKKIVTPIYKVTDALTTKNHCREDMIRRIAARAGLKSTDALHIVRVDAPGGTDAWQVFSPECPGGYFYAEFKPSLGADRCLLGSYPSMPDQLHKLEAYGDCHWKSVAKAGAISSDVALPADPRLTGRAARKAAPAEPAAGHPTETSGPRSDADVRTGSADRGE